MMWSIMKRRNFILSAGALATISLTITGTIAGFADSISAVGDFRAIHREEPEASLETSPNSANRSSKHTWECTSFYTEFDIETITAFYPDGTSFDGLSDNEITVEFDRNGDGDTTEIGVNSDDYSGSTATFNLSGNFNRNIEGLAIVTIEGIENPDADVYTPELEFTTEADSARFEAEMAITDDSAYYASEITNVPESVTAGDSFSADYTITNTGSGPGDQTITVSVDGTEAVTTDLALEPDESYSDTFSDSTTSDDAPSVDLMVETEDSSDAREITITGAWSLDLDPAGANESSVHTWSTGFVDFDGEVDTITTAYSGGDEGASFDGLTNDDITVEITRDGETSPTEISVNNDSYSGSTATFDLSGVFNTDIDGDVIVEIDGIENPGSGDYEADITLDGDNDTVSSTVEFEI